jgi:peroxiredoxin/outer membrane lipoprotein-sorting protein
MCLIVSVVAMIARASVAQTTNPIANPATNPSTQPTIDPAARVLLDQVRDAYAKVSTLELAGSFTLDADAAGEKQNQTATFIAAFQAPTKFRHEMKDDVLVVSTGEKLFSVLVPRNQYISVEAPTERGSTLAGGVGDLLREQNPSLALALSKDAGAELAEGTTAVEKVPDVTIDGKSFAALKLTQKDRDVLLLIDAENGLLRQMQVDLKKLFTEQGVPQVNKAMITINYDKTTAGGALDAAKFAFAPPPGATLIKTEMAFMGDQQGGPGSGDPSDEPAQKLVGQAAPAFKLEGLDGKEISPLEDFKGKVIVLDFWATWCPPCREGLPHLDQLYKAQGEQGVAIFAVNEREAADKAKTFMTQQNLSIPVLLDSKGEVGGQYLVTGIPQTVVIGKNGKIANIFVGFGEGSAEKLAQAVETAKAK